MRLLLALLLASSTVACAPTLTDDTPYVTSARVLAVRMDPPEATPGESVQLTALYADSTGALSMGPLTWGYCVARKPLAELGPVAQSCLAPTSTDLVPLGSGLVVAGGVPSDACSLFGPNPPPPTAGQPAGRPVDPDSTGGYYQPALGFLTDDSADPTLVSVRIRCGLANVSQETYVAWNSTYRSNANPQISGLVMQRGADLVPVPEDGTAAPPVVSPGETVTFTLAWPECPTTGVCGDGVCSSDEDTSSCPGDCLVPRGCGGAETFVYYDEASATLTTQREAMSGVWFTSAGTFAEERGGRAADDPANTLSFGWTAPSTGGDVYLAVVLRDSRGGVQFASYRLAVMGNP